jgi:hypothetical protein
LTSNATVKGDILKMISVVNPRGQFAPIQQFPMAPRLSTLEGKTIYIVNARWPYTEQVPQEIRNALSERFPRTTFELRDKAGSYGEDDPQLWQEIKSKGDGMILAVGH